ncbi:MAG: hypothetical protein ACRDDY_05415 [Clostridium sp.]|uniref:hypothetical protein n=1 Tax=Clostridium sp. TaxID=1506 RepID=UPI003EE481F9
MIIHLYRNGNQLSKINAIRPGINVAKVDVCSVANPTFEFEFVGEVLKTNVSIHSSVFDTETTARKFLNGLRSLCRSYQNLEIDEALVPVKDVFILHLSDLAKGVARVRTCIGDEITITRDFDGVASYNVPSFYAIKPNELYQNLWLKTLGQ